MVCSDTRSRACATTYSYYLLHSDDFTHPLHSDSLLRTLVCCRVCPPTPRLPPGVSDKLFLTGPPPLVWDFFFFDQIGKMSETLIGFAVIFRALSHKIDEIGGGGSGDPGMNVRSQG